MKWMGSLLIMVVILTALYGGEDKGSQELIVIETEYGKIVIDLFEEDAPLHSSNFKKLAREGFFDSTLFHRLVPGFVIQGGDPLSKDQDLDNDGRGGPGYTVPAEIGRKHLRGAIGAARQGDNVNPRRESNGSQFYICLDHQPHLDRLGYTIFGQVVQGMEVVERMADIPVRGQAPIHSIRMKKVYVTTSPEQEPNSGGAIP